VKKGFIDSTVCPKGLGMKIPKHCRRLAVPNTAPKTIPPVVPIVIAPIATGIIPRVISMMPILIGRLHNKKMSADRIASRVRVWVFVFFIFVSLLLFLLGYSVGLTRVKP